MPHTKEELRESIIKFYNATPVYKTAGEWITFVDSLLEQREEEIREFIANETMDLCENSQKFKEEILKFLSLPPKQDILYAQANTRDCVVDNADNPQWEESFKSEFGIHFSESELQFALEFIREVELKAYRDGRAFLGEQKRIARQEGFDEGVAKLKTFLNKSCLEYCRQQNGIDECKNCGLSEELMDEGLKAF